VISSRQLSPLIRAKGPSRAEEAGLSIATETQANASKSGFSSTITAEAEGVKKSSFDRASRLTFWPTFWTTIDSATSYYLLARKLSPRIGWLKRAG
jgi:hypothetical protein